MKKINKKNMKKEDCFKKTVNLKRGAGSGRFSKRKKMIDFELDLLSEYREKLEQKSQEVFISLRRKEFRAADSSEKLINKLNRNNG
jgi:hypothetical protein